MATKSEKLIYSAVGRRKSSVARVFLTPGTGAIVVNGKKAEEYFPHKVLLLDINQTFALKEKRVCSYKSRNRNSI